MGKITGRIFVGFVSFLISFISYSSQIFVIWPWYGGVLSVELVMLLAPFNLIVGMLWWNYYLCVTTDPGRVPDSWQPDTQSGDGYEVKKLTGSPRFCRSCEKYKPPRAHHCKVCNRCILRMDHHCPWINNCVGYFNYGHFIRFLFFVDIACSYHLTMVTRRVFDTMGARYWDEPSGTELVFIILNYTLSIPVLLAVGAFSLYHFYGLLGNSTTIEGWEKDKVATLVRRGKMREIKFPYNLGARRNIASVLGDDPKIWCWPTVPPGTGLKFQLAEGDDLTSQAQWPPTDPTIQHHPQVDDDEEHVLTLPSSPWTYSNGALNPDLHPTSARKRKSRKTAKLTNGLKSSLPPYHPDYEPPLEGDGNGIEDLFVYSSASDVSSSDGYDAPVIPGAGHMRRGSEGYELPPIDREAMLRRYIEEQVGEEGRYNVYVPEPESGSTGDDEETVPLAKKVESWRAHASDGVEAMMT